MAKTASVDNLRESAAAGGNWFSRARKFLIEVRGELSRVTWPTRREVWATTVVVIAVTAVLQILVQLVMFMHMNTKADEGWNVMSFVFTLTILVLVVGGSLWIMQHLHLNMMIG